MVTEIGWDTVAIVVSFNGVSKLEKTLAALRHQVRHVVIVDNGSRSDALPELRALARRFDTQLIENGENLGIGAALNCGLAASAASQAKWVLTMDQDSTVASDFFDALTQSLIHDPSIVCATPVLNGGDRHDDERPKIVKYAITSGNLIGMNVLRQVGVFDEGMFIDGVDFDYSLRVRRAGYCIHRISTAHMVHDLGERPSSVPFYTIHSPLRRYYMHRNFIILLKRYFSFDAPFLIKLTIAHTLSSLLTLLLGPDRSGHALSMVKGTIDGLRGRQGARGAAC